MAVALHEQDAMEPSTSHGVPLLEVGAALQMEVFTRRYYDLFNERRFDEAERFVHPQGVFIYLAAKEHFIGRAGYRELTRRWISAFPDARLTITSVSVLGIDLVRTDWVGEGTHLGPLEVPGIPPIPATRVHAKLPMRETIRVTDGLIVESRMEFDPQELRQSLKL